jgi:hypothetical protein
VEATPIASGLSRFQEKRSPDIGQKQRLIKGLDAAK